MENNTNTEVIENSEDIGNEESVEKLSVDKITLPDKFETNIPPYIKGFERTGTMMLDTLIALLPSFVWGVFAFGIRALLLALISVVCAVGFELLVRVLMHRRICLTDFSPIITGLLIAMCLPVNAPLWMPVLGVFFAIVVVKQCFGGLGKNIFNPAVAGVVLLSLGERAVSTFFKTAGGAFSDGTATLPLDALKNGVLPEESVFDLIIGNSAGGIGEVSALFLVAGGVYLLCRRVISWHIPASFIGTVAVITLIFPRYSGVAAESMLYELLSGALILAAFFMATDHTTSPMTDAGKIIFGVGCGLITVLIRYFGTASEGVMYAILLMNLTVPFIEKITKPRPFGSR